MDTHYLIGIGICLAFIGGLVFMLRPGAPAAAEAERPDRSADPENGFSIESRRRAVRAALRNYWKMTIVYVDEKGDRTERTIFPLYWNNKSSIRARCELRQAERSFRVDRMERIRVHAATEKTSAKYHVG